MAGTTSPRRRQCHAARTAILRGRDSPRLASAAAIVRPQPPVRRYPEPSAEDVALTRRLAAAGTLLGIEVLDHAVIGEAGRFVSLKERGVL